MSDAPHPPTSPTAGPLAPGDLNGRCHACGYILYQVAASGQCPECGLSYSAESIQRLQPWPSAFDVCLRLGWPILGLFGAVILGVMLPAGPKAETLSLLLVFVGAAFLLATPVNSWIQVRRMLKASLPEQKRTRGAVATLRALGTVVCILAFLFLLLPFLLLGACLVMQMSGQLNFH